MMHPTPPTTTSRPLPKRLHTLQHTPCYGPLTPLRATPHGFSYPSLLSSPTSPTSPTPAGRPGAPKRSHSFCGDSSASTYALASASSAGHLSADKKVLVAPPLERTISSIGNRGNFSPPEQQMKRPFLLDARSRPSRSGPPTPPSSPPRGLPQIVLHTPSPARPSLNPLQHSPTRAPVDHQTSSMSDMSRASSFALVTPADSHTNSTLFGSFDLDSGKVLPGSQGQQDEDDLMEVDDMIERVEELAL